jgi:hypothetical protein
LRVLVVECSCIGIWEGYSNKGKPPIAERQAQPNDLR